MKRTDLPDLLGVFADGTVAGEAAHVRDVEETPFLPCGGIAVEERDLVLHGGIGIEIRAAHVEIGFQAVEDGTEQIAFTGREEVVADEAEGAAQERRAFDEFAGRITF